MPAFYCVEKMNETIVLDAGDVFFLHVPMLLYSLVTVLR